jgi:excisionase family DNA binding protein
VSEQLLLRPSELVALLGLSRSRIYSLAQAGELPGVVRLGGSVRVHRPTLEVWLAEQANGNGIRRAPAPAKASAPEVSRRASDATTALES